MALCAPDSNGLAAKQGFFDLSARADFESRRAPVYRCAGCGSEIPFDALAVSCLCIDEVNTPDASGF
jgi:hypothetical protein